MAGAKGRERGQANVRVADTNDQETPGGQEQCRTTLQDDKD